MKNNLILSLVIAVLFSITYVSALTNSINLNIQCENSGVVCTGSYSYKFDLSTNTDCSSPDYTTTKSITTDARGIFSTTLTNVNLDFVNNNYRLCVYRDLVLKSNLTISTVPYSYYAQNTSWVGVSGRPTALSQFTNDIGVNSSFNQSLTDTLYLGKTDQRYNETGVINSMNGSWLSTYNATYSQFAYNQTFNNNTGSVNRSGCWLNYCNPDSYLPFAYNHTSFLFGQYGSNWYNHSQSLINQFGAFWYNMTSPAITDINSRFWNKTQSYNKTEIDANNASWTATYNLTYDKKGDFFFANFSSSFDSNFTGKNNSLSVNNSNCWKGDCGGFRDTSNQATNTTSDVLFDNLNATNTVTIDTPFLGTALQINVFNIPVFRFDTSAAYIVLQSMSNLPFILCNDDCTAQNNFNDDGSIQFKSLKGLSIENATGVSFRGNQTGTYSFVDMINTGTINNLTGNVEIGKNLSVIGEFKLVANSTSRPCSTANEGNVYYDGSTKRHYGCNSTTWNALY